MEKDERSRFSGWESYLDALERCAVPEERRKWFVRWAERFAAFLGGRPLETAERPDVEAFLTSLTRTPRVEPWQLRQASEALKILLVMVFGKRWGEGVGVRGELLGPEEDGGDELGRDDPLYAIRTVCRNRNDSPRAGKEVPERPAGVALAVRLPRLPPVHRPLHRAHPQPP